MTRRPCPPRLARALAAVLLRGEMREIVLGDLDEEFAGRVAAGERPAVARRRYWRQALASIAMRYTRTTSEPTIARRSIFEGTWQDLRHAARVLKRAPGFTAIALLSLSIGIGATTTVYNVIHKLLIVSLPVERADELRLVYWTRPPKTRVTVNEINSDNYADAASGQSYSSNFSYAMAASMRRAIAGRAPLVAFNFMPQLSVSIDGQPARVAGGLLASGEYDSTLQLGLAVGRAFGPADDRPGAPAVVVLGYDFWQRAFGADRAAVGRSIRVNGVPCEIVGVTKRGYRGLSQGGYTAPSDLTMPLSTQPLIMPRRSLGDSTGSLLTSNAFWVRLLTRVSESDADINRAMTTAAREEYARLPGAEAADLERVRAQLVPGARGLDSMRTDVARPLLLVAGVAAIVLLMACLNLAGLMLARGLSRQRELAVRRALGAGRWRLVRVVMTESLLLSLAGGGLGLVLAWWTGPLVAAMTTTGLGAIDLDFGLDWSLVGGAAVISIAAAVMAGLVPALRLSGRGMAALSQRGAMSGARLTAGRALVALQIAVSVQLVVGAGLFLRTIYNFSRADLGFDPAGLVVFRIDPAIGAANGIARDPAEIYARVLERTARLPDVRSATLVENVLISGWSSNTDVAIDGQRVSMRMNAVGPRFFETMGIPILAGRGIDERDRAGAPPVVVINQAAAEKFFPGASPIGRRFMVGRREVEIVGIAATTRYRSLRTPPEPSFYDAYGQRAGAMPGLEKMLGYSGPGRMHVVLRTSGSVATLAQAIPAAVNDVEPDLVPTNIKTQTDQIGDSIARERMFTRLLVIFGAFGVLLTCIGLHGVTSYSVARRTSEIGIRVALGARRAQVLWLILRQVLVVALAGLVIGVPIALALGPVVASLLFGLEPRDVVTIAAAVAALLVVAIAAGWLPARRAARLEVVSALRQE